MRQRLDRAYHVKASQEERDPEDVGLPERERNETGRDYRETPPSPMPSI